MKNAVVKILEWLKSSFGEGNASSRRLTAFWYTVLVTIDVFITIILASIVIIKQMTVDARAFDALEYIAIALITGTAALLGITTWQNIAQLKKDKNEKTTTDTTDNGGSINQLE
jgi:ABC-type nickel/cobalt efflux system permease component RcnA